MWDPVGHYIYATRDMVWLKRMRLTRKNAIEYSVVPVIVSGENQEPSEDSEEAASNSKNKNQDKTLKLTC